MRNIVLLLSFFFANNLYSESIPTNYRIIDSLSSAFASNITHDLINKGITNVGYNINNHAIKSLIEMNIVESLSDNNISIVSGELPTMITVNIGEVKVLYDLHSDADSLKRNIFFEASAILKHYEETKLLSRDHHYYSDVIARVNIADYEDKSFPFTQAELPEPKLSLFDKIIKPAVYVVTAAVVILLLFTVRSN